MTNEAGTNGSDCRFSQTTELSNGLLLSDNYTYLENVIDMFFRATLSVSEPASQQSYWELLVLSIKN
jgi:hypothetical protein